MSIKTFLFFFWLMFFGVQFFYFPCVARAEGIVSIVSISNDSVQKLQKGFTTVLAEAGVNASNSIYILQEKGAAAVSALVRAQKPVLTLAFGSEAASLLKNELVSFPAIFALVGNNAEFESANASGVSFDIPASLKVDIIKSVLPAVKRVGVIYSPASKDNFDEVVAACKNVGLATVGRQISTEADFVNALQDIMEGQADCLMMIIDTKVYFGQTIKLLFLESNKNKIPVIGLSHIFTKRGALLSIDCDYLDLGRQVGEMGLSVIKGGHSKSQRPRKATYSVNAALASKYGITIPAPALSEAVEVFR